MFLLLAQVLFVATPFTPENSFTSGVEGPATDKAGNVYAVSYQKTDTIGRFTPDGKGEVWLTMPEGSLGNGIRFTPEGRMFVADYKAHNILEIDPATRKVSVFAKVPTPYQPNDIELGPDGTLWASDPDLMAGMEGNDTTGFNGNGFASAWVSTRTSRFGAILEITKTRDFDVFTINQFLRDQIKKSVDHVLGLTLV